MTARAERAISQGVGAGRPGAALGHGEHSAAARGPTPGTVCVAIPAMGTARRGQRTGVDRESVSDPGDTRSRDVPWAGENPTPGPRLGTTVVAPGRSPGW